MARSLKQAVLDLFKDAKKSKSAMRRILQPAAEGAGTGVHPPRTAKNDEKYGIRLDKGVAVGNEVQLSLQINSNATKKTLKNLVQKHGSHATYATVNVDPAQEITEENMDKLAEEICDEVDKAL
jgi:hypothetical protein